MVSRFGFGGVLTLLVRKDHWVRDEIVVVRIAVQRSEAMV